MTVRHATLPALLGALLLAAGAGPARADLNCNAGVDFYDDGRLRGCVLNGRHRLHTRAREAVVCADGARAEQHRDGALARCTLAEPARVGGRDCAAGSEVAFAEDGRLLRCKDRPPG